MKPYFFPSVRDESEIEQIPFYPFTSYHWEAPIPYRPKTFAKLYVFENSLCAELKCYEENPKAVFTKRDEPIWCDSCLEFFVKPFLFKDEYINIETNANGVFLSEIGKGKTDRVYIKLFTDLAPDVSAFKSEDADGRFWSVKIRLTADFLSSVYQINSEEVRFDNVFCNFYKCGDECETPHYIAFNPVTTLPPGFHNPDCFAKFILES